MSKGEIRSYEGCIKVGPWGGPKGDVWIYKPNSPIKELIIVHGGVIDSLRFKSQNFDGLDVFSVKFGGRGGDRTSKIGINSPLEYLTTVSGTFGDFNGVRAVKSLCFYTNFTKYGPFGSNDGHAFSFPMESGEVVGFFGRAGTYIDAMGIYVAPKSSISPKLVVLKQEYIAGKEITDAMKGDMMPREVGAWGGSGGKPWDDGVFSFVKEVRLITKTIPSEEQSQAYVATAVQFKYVNRDGRTVTSPLYGSERGTTTETIITMDGKTEYLVGISGFYGPIKSGRNSTEGITCLTFYTNKGRYGPYGDEFGTYFTSISSAGKVVGFHGRSGICLNAIGVHMEYV